MKLNLAFLLLVTLIVITACNTKTFESEYINSEHNDNSIVIDGKDDDWKSSTYNFPDDGYSIDFNNDEDYLYIRFIPLGSEIMNAMLMRGFTLWLENRQSDELLGLRITNELGRDNFGSPMRRGSDEKDGPRKSLPGFESIGIYNSNSKEFDDYLIKQLKGLDIVMGYDREAMIYEMKIPIVDSAEFPIGLAMKDNNEIAFEFELNDFEKPDMSEMSEMGNSSGDGMRSRGAGRESGMSKGKGMQGGGKRQSMQKTMNLKGLIILADKQEN